MAIVTFYLLDSPTSETTESVNKQDIDLDIVVSLILTHCQQGAKIYIHCQDKQHALDLDERLWQLPAEKLVPYRLVGEHASAACQVEIAWQGIPYNGYRQILINLAQQVPIFAPSLAQVIEFVPCDDDLKQRARERYQIYRQAGHQLKTLALDTTSNT